MHIRWQQIVLAYSVLLAAAVSCPAQQPDAGAIAPLVQPGMSNVAYLGLQHAQYDYELLNTNGSNTRATTNGIDFEVAYRQKSDIEYVATARYGMGSPDNEKMLTIGAGAGYVKQIGRYQPFVEIMGGLSRLQSPDLMYLSRGLMTGFTFLYGAGLDVNIGPRWGVRPIDYEVQHLAFGDKGSNYTNISAGAYYRFADIGFKLPHFVRKK